MSQLDLPVEQPASGLINTNPARCRDCYRCVRTCPVKAVRVRDGQAQVVHELCIACANCVRACPQQAKVSRDDRPAVQAALQAGRPVIASVAPSAPAYFEIATFNQIEDALRQLGFAAAEETAFGAEMVGLAHGDLVHQMRNRWPLIASSCPVVVSLVEHCYPDLIPHLAPIVSPMIAHGRYLRQQHGPQAFIVFIGPCIAKKGEIVEPELQGAIDAALTFDELEEWMQQVGVILPPADPRTAPPSQRTNVFERINARLFPVEGGLVGTANMDTDILSGHTLAASGIGTCQNVLEGIRSGAVEACLVELLACGGGCINGPALMDHKSVILSRQRVMAYATRRQPKPLPTREQWPNLGRSYQDYSQPEPQFTEEQISQVLHQVDKYTPEDEYNCGACGYDSCRDKARAVLRGMAEATMCVPFMRSRAESLTNVVMDVTPNAILIIDRSLHIQGLSASAEKMFNCRRINVLGHPLRSIVPVIEDFVAVRDQNQPAMNKIVRQRADLIVEQSIVPVGNENLIVGILRDVTGREQERDKMARLRAETLQRTQEVIQQQMRVAHEIAGLLGETTAETKVLLTQLARLVDRPAEDAE